MQPKAVENLISMLLIRLHPNAVPVDGTGGDGGILSEQVWDNAAPAGATPGRPDYSASPLGWAHGQFIRLAWTIQDNDVISRPANVACRYQHLCPGTTAPGAPGAPAASGVTSGSVKLDWTAAPAGSNPLAGYDVYQVGSPDKVVASTGAGTLSATVTGLAPATAYQFYVKAKDSTGLVSPASATVSVTTAAGPAVTPPTAPGTPVASGTTDTATTLTWPTSTAGTNPLAGYDIYQVGSPDKVVASTGAGTLSATVTGLAPATAYQFYVKAKDSTGLVSPASASVSVTTKSAQPTGSAKVAYATTSDWGSGFTAQITLTNTGTQTLDHWNLAFAFPGNQHITSGWGGTWSQSGFNVTASGASWNGTLAPGQSVTVGFSGTYSGTNTAPTAFTLNGNPATTG